MELKEVWLRYFSLAPEQNMDIPSSFGNRMTTFKEHIALHVAGVYDFVFLHDQAVSERQTVLVPIKFIFLSSFETTSAVKPYNLDLSA